MELIPLPQQRRAIEAPLGPVLVVAGPGAGKTFCLISRIQHVIEQGLDPKRVCAVTFTNRAAEEIADRLKAALGDRAESITRGTIHALCLGLLREFPEAVGLQRGFGVADEQYQDVILHRLRVPQERRSGMLSRFGRHRFQQYALAPDEARLYREYVGWLEHRNMVDFDDLIVKAEALLRQPVAEDVPARWEYLLVDEFQDINAVQYDFLKRLAARHGNFYAVGDDEQSIFAWTGADPMVLERFRRDYDVAPIILDKNCRCARPIFETARRVLAHNPRLFDKQLTSDIESPHDVEVRIFRDEYEEAKWLIGDLGRESDAAILYRKHNVGRYLEGQLLRADIPCRLARGQSLIEDKVIGYVIAALRVVRSPDDPAALQAFARIVLSEHFLQEVEAALDDREPFLASVRKLAARRVKSDPDTAKLWRLIYQVENLRALPKTHDRLEAVIDEILSQTAGPYRNKLEERHDELSDPGSWPDAVRLAEALGRAETIAIAPRGAGGGGAEIAIRGMVGAAGFHRVSVAPGGIDADALTVFKALQLVHAREFASLARYVTFDFETTDKDVETCGVIEVGAARVVNGEIVDRFHSMVNPYQPISLQATAVHGYTDADVALAAPFREVFAQFRAFVGDDILIAHNGQNFDIPVLKRLAAGHADLDSLVFYDTYPLARSLSRDRASQEDLAHRFGIDCGRAHHALDDAVTLAQVYRELEKQRTVRARKAVLANLLDYLAMALALEGTEGGERRLLWDIGRYRTLGPYSDALEFYAASRTADHPTLETLIERLGGPRLMTRLRAQRDPTQRYASAVARLRALIEDGPPDLTAAIAQLLERVALSSSDDEAASHDRVNLLTLHSTKGLEFERVYIVGVEDYEIPGYQAATNNIQDEIEEARRLLYVGMTRARQRLTLTRAARRFGRETGGSALLEEMALLAGDQLRDKDVALPVLNVKE
ncbi:MAG TPA: UvrD-helicase domain-containing protein [Gemmatimonadales bacterium]